MITSHKTCTNCKKSLPDYIDVGSRCPHCGVYFGKKEVHTITDSYSVPRAISVPWHDGITMPVLAAILFPFVLPLVLVFVLNTDSSFKFYLGMLVFEASLVFCTLSLFDLIKNFRSGDLKLTDPYQLFFTIIWAIITIKYLYDVILSIGSAYMFENSIIRGGLSTFIGFWAAAGIALIPTILFELYESLKKK